MLVHRELTGLLVALCCCHCAGPPAPAPKAKPPRPVAAVRPAPLGSSPAPAASDVACLDPTPPRTRPPSDVEAFERIARNPTGNRDERARAALQAAQLPADLRKGAAAYRGLFEDECVGTGSVPNEQCDEVGYNAGHLLALTGDRAGASRVLTQLRDPSNQIGDYGLARRLECELAGKPPEECEKATTKGSR
jgi:hypothetical protein